ncbi:PREDICTED: uncharacterized protein LOC109319223 [Crocodylus porosus]|uniref:uncharacterized protein LOC109319223 n=1 Tax=Crocodylus porosus TaxID=8502 RepID=UPI00093A72EA|nr:PREDICTED: uncharacterized protein LOC109319223 [Crocodylus porosus]
MTWKKGTNKVAEWDGHQFKYYGSLTGRAELSLSSGNLTILSAQAGDTGIYEVEILAEDDDSSSTGMIQRCYYNLNVTGPLLPPGLNCTIVKNRLEIFCHTDLSTNVGYFWWYSNMDRLIWENNIAKLPLTADRSQKIYCIIEVSGGRINGSLSLDECPVVKLIQTRARTGLIALFYFVAVLITLILIAIFLQKTGHLPNWIASRLPGGGARHPKKQNAESETEPFNEINNDQIQGGGTGHPKEQNAESETEPFNEINNDQIQDGEAEDGKTPDKSEEDASGKDMKQPAVEDQSELVSSSDK